MDIVERLRVQWSAMGDMANAERLEASDEIEKLREERSRLREGNKDIQLHFDAIKYDYERLRKALKKIGDGDTCIALLTHPTICKRAYDARAALKGDE